MQRLIVSLIMPALLLSLAGLLSACEQEPNVVTTESGLQYIELEEGDGEQPQPGQVVEVHYRGAGGPLGPLLDLALHRSHRRQAFRDALWRLKQSLEEAA